MKLLNCLIFFLVFLHFGSSHYRPTFNNKEMQIWQIFYRLQAADKKDDKKIRDKKKPFGIRYYHPDFFFNALVHGNNSVTIPHHWYSERKTHHFDAVWHAWQSIIKMWDDKLISISERNPGEYQSDVLPPEVGMF